jgi:cytochrome b subunit of formate dehydrogenase
VLAQGAGTMFWFLPLYYTVILVSGIILTYRCYQETIIVTDYYPDQGVY